MDLKTQTCFLAHITDGYTFRNTMSIIKCETDMATMILSPTGIEISFLNSSGCAMHNVTINPRELIGHHYDVRDEQGNLMPECPITFDTSEMFNTSKSIGRRDSIRLYWLRGDNKINVQPIKASIKDNNRVGTLFVNIKHTEYTKYASCGHYSDEPNVRVQAKDFADLCSQTNSLKCSAMDITGRDNEILFKGIMPNNKVASMARIAAQVNHMSLPPLGDKDLNAIDELHRTLDVNSVPLPQGEMVNLTIIPKEELMTIRIPIGTVKAMSKVHNISPTGTLLRFFFAEGLPTLKIVSPIGSYGTYVICLRNYRRA